MKSSSMELILVDESQKESCAQNKVGNFWDDTWNAGGARVGWKELQKANGVLEVVELDIHAQAVAS